MKWERDTLVDQLIAKNVARPRPGMDKPDVAMMTLPGKGQKTAATASIQTAESAQAGVPMFLRADTSFLYPSIYTPPELTLSTE